MTDAYRRPYRPLALDGAQLEEFILEPRIEQLRTSGTRDLSAQPRR